MIDGNSPTIGILKDRIRGSRIINDESIAFKNALDLAIMDEINNEIDKESYLGKLFTLGIQNGSIVSHSMDSSKYLDGIGVNNNIMNNMMRDVINTNPNLAGKVTVKTSKRQSDEESEHTRIRNEIISLLNKGIPVLFGGKGFEDKNNNGILDTNSEESLYGHVSVAYAYDDMNDTIYGHLGWEGYENSYVDISEIFNYSLDDYWYLDIGAEIPQTFSNNYYFIEKKSCYCPYAGVMPVLKSNATTQTQGVVVDNQTTWLIFETPDSGDYRVFAQKNIYNPFSMLSPILNIVIDGTNIVDGLANDVDFYSVKGSVVYIGVAGYFGTTGVFHIRIAQHEIPYNKQEWQLWRLTETMMKPNEYGYKEQYHFEEQYSDVSLADFSFKTRRLRTGYISKEYIVMSPRRVGAGVAFLEYEFENSISKINVDLSLWSSSELLRPSDCTALIQYKNLDGLWVTAMDLLNDVELSTDKNNPNTFTIDFPDGIKEIRFYSTAPQIGVSNNTGRLCIGNMTIYYYE